MHNFSMIALAQVRIRLLLGLRSARSMLGDDSSIAILLRVGREPLPTEVLCDALLRRSSIALDLGL